MKSEWYVSCMKINGDYEYIAQRVLDITKPVHSGNVERYGAYTTDRKTIENLVKELNERERDDNQRAL